MRKYTSMPSLHDEAAIHRFRTTYKKLRAFLRMLRYAPAVKGEMKIPAALKQLYRQAGILRNLQLYYHALLPYYQEHEAAPYLKTVHRHIEQAQYDLDHLARSTRMDLIAEKITQQLPVRFSGKKVNRFIKNKNKELKGMLRPEMSDAHLHSVRKYLKDVLYDLKRFDKEVSSFLPIAGIRYTKPLKQLYELLGEYQDYVACLHLVYTLPAKKLHRHELSVLNNAADEWERKKEHLRTAILALLNI